MASTNMLGSMMREKLATMAERPWSYPHFSRTVGATKIITDSPSPCTTRKATVL